MALRREGLCYRSRERVNLLDAPNGGDVPTPIPAQQTSGTTLDITMSIAGTFGDECNFHPGTMFGAIEVVP